MFFRYSWKYLHIARYIDTWSISIVRYLKNHRFLNKIKFITLQMDLNKNLVFTHWGSILALFIEVFTINFPNFTINFRKSCNHLACLWLSNNLTKYSLFKHIFVFIICVRHICVFQSIRYLYWNSRAQYLKSALL